MSMFGWIRRKKKNVPPGRVETRVFSEIDSDQLLSAAVDREKHKLRLSKGQLKLLRMRSS